MKNMKRIFCLLPLLLLSFALLAGCGSSGSTGSSGRKWHDADVIDDYGTVTRNGKQINVCVCHDQKAVYLYYDDEKHELFDIAKLPTDEFYDDDKDWLLGRIDFSDLTDDNNGDLQVYISHSDMTESHIVWTWEEGTGYVYKPDSSCFYDSIVVTDPPYDDSENGDDGEVSEQHQRDISEFQGAWYYDNDLSAMTYIIIDDYGNWSYFQRVPGDAEGTEMDHGTLSCSADEGSTYYADSAMYNDVQYQVLDFDEGILVWGDEGTYYRMEDFQ